MEYREELICIIQQVVHTKRQKMIIDYTNIVLTVAATVIFIIVLFLRSKSGILFPIEFLLGTIVNALTSVKHFINGNKVSGLIVAVVAVLILRL